MPSRVTRKLIRAPSDMAVASEACPVCAAHGDRPIYPDVLDPITLDHFRVGECPHCGMAYTAPRPASLDRYYPSVYRDYGRLVTHILGMLYGVRVSRWARLKAEGGSVLEVGCGPGLMLAAFRRRGWRVLGIERNEKVGESARQSLGLEIVAVPVEALPKDARFDLIVMFQVLEHIGDPVPLLRECAKRLAPGGRLIINVPNFSSWQARFARAKWFHLDVPRHLVHYTPQTLSAALERAGLRLVSLSFASPEHDPYGWVESTISHLVGRQNVLTRFLMGLDPFDKTVLVSFILGALLLVPTLMLAGVSWIAKRGALMEATAVNSTPR